MTPHNRVAFSRKLALLVPLVLVNAVAVWGQAGWAYNHITETGWTDSSRLVMSLLFAAAVESIGVYLAWEAHSALMADQSSGLLRVGSYAIGLLAGFLNYAHFAGDTYTATPQAITFGLLSAISPWLWAIRSRSMNRGRLAELDMIDERGLKLSTSRKFWHPLRSVKVISWAAWEGVTKPETAVAGWEASRPPARPKAAGRAPREVPAEAPVSPAPLPLSGEVVAAPAARMPRIPADRTAVLARALKEQDPSLTPRQIGAWLGKGESTIRGYLREQTGEFPIVGQRQNGSDAGMGFQRS